MLGHGSRAYQYYKAYLPAAYNERAELREIEPYVYGQSTFSKYSPRYGKSRIPWLTGTAAWAYYAASNYILGIRPQYEGLLIDPCVPADWKEFKIRRIFRGSELNITVKNPSGAEKGAAEITLNGHKTDGNLIRAEQLEKVNEIIVIMG